MTPLIPVIIPIVATFLAAITVVLSTVIYGLLYPWQKSTIGRSLFFGRVAWSLALVFTLINFFTGFYRGILIIESAVFLLIAAVHGERIYRELLPPEEDNSLNVTKEDCSDEDDERV